MGSKKNLSVWGLKSFPPKKLSRAVPPYAAVHRLISFAEQDAWQANPAFNSFCVFYAGRYVRARGHFWQRGNTKEGVYLYCTAGRGFYRCDGKEWPVGPGDLVYCFPFTGHSYGADAKQPWSIYWMHVAGSEVTTYSSLLGFTRDRPVIRVGVRPHAVAAFKTLFLFLRPPMDDTKISIVSAAARLLLALMAVGRDSRPGDSTNAASVQQVLEAMQRHVDGHPRIADWAKLFGGSRSHFQRQFKLFTGHTPNAYFMRMKIQRACSLLTATPLRVTEISSRLGFSDPFYFSRIFRRLTDYTPSDYRLYAHQVGSAYGKA